MIPAQIFGGAAIACSLIIYSRKERKHLLLFKSLQDLFWLVHYLLLSAFSAAATSGLCIVRSAVFYRNGGEKKRKAWVLGLFLGLYALSAVLTWKSPFSLLPALSSSVSTVAFWMRDPRHTKLLAILASCCTLGYNLAVAHSPSVYLGVSVTVLTSLVSLLTSGRKGKQK